MVAEPLRRPVASMLSGSEEAPYVCNGSMSTCIACHGSGCVTTTFNVLLFQLLASREQTSSRALEDFNTFTVCRESTNTGPSFVVLETACGRGSVICKACQEFDFIRCIGIHAELENLSARSGSRNSPAQGRRLILRFGFTSHCRVREDLLSHGSQPGTQNMKESSFTF